MRRRNSQYMERKNDKARMRNLRKKLAKWEREGRDERSVPTLQKPLEGAEALYRAHSLEPGIDVFVPTPGVPKSEELKARQRFKYRKYGVPRFLSALTAIGREIEKNRRARRGV